MTAKLKPSTETAAAIAAALAPTPARPAVQEQGTSLPSLPAIGEQVTVQDPTGALLNLETGQRFVAGEPTPQRVTTHTRQRLQDGGLVLVV